MATKTKNKEKAKKKVTGTKGKSVKPAKNKAKAKAKPKAKVTLKPAKAKASAKTKAKPVAKPVVAKAKVANKAQAKQKPQPKPKVMPQAMPKIKPEKPIEKVKEKETTKATGTGLKNRYSDKDLVEFKGIILDKLSEARRDLELLRSSMSHLDDHGTDDTSPTFKLMEDGSDVLTKEETAQLAARQQKFIKHLEDALIRIENKSYGICRVTGNLIPKERLRVVPHATLSIEAKQKQF